MPTSRRSALSSRRTRASASTSTSVWATRSAMARRPTSAAIWCASTRPSASWATTTPRSPDAWTTRIILRRRASGARPARVHALQGEHGLAARAALPAPRRILYFCHGSPLNLEEFDYIFAPEQAARCQAIYDELGDVTFIGHSHLCKSVPRLTRDEVFEVVAPRFVIRPGHKYIVERPARSASRATTTTAPATPSTTPKRRPSSSGASPTTSRAAANKIYDAELGA